MKACLSCDDTGIVDAIRQGERRPCARCRPEDFNAWYQERLAADRAEREAERKRIHGK